MEDSLAGGPIVSTANSPRSALGIVVGTFLAVVIAANVFVVGVLVLAPSLGIPETNPLPIVLAGIVPQLGMLGVGYWYMTRRLNRVPLSVPSLRGAGIIVGATVALIMLAIAEQVLASVAGIELASTVVTEAGAQNPTVFLLVALLSILIVGPAEEFLFRGAYQSDLRRVFGPGLSIGLPAVLFGLLHIPNYALAGEPLLSGFLWFSILTISIDGALFGVLFEWTDNLAIPILVHGLYNVTIVGLTLLGL